MNRRTALLAATLAVTVAGAVLVGCESKTAEAACSSASECLPAITYQDINHEMYPPDALKGKIVVVNFWATWCPPCKKEIPAFNRVYAKYKDRGVVMLGMLSDNTVDDAGLLNFMSDNEFTYPVVKVDFEIQQAYAHPSALPTTFIYDRTGKLAKKQPGEMSEEQLATVLDGLLQDAPRK